VVAARLVEQGKGVLVQLGHASPRTRSFTAC